MGLGLVNYNSLTLQLNFSRRSGPDTGYYSDRNDARNGFRDERGYLSDHSSRYICEMKTQGAQLKFVSRGLAPNFRQDSIRSGYISDHESRSGYEHRGEFCGETGIPGTQYIPLSVSDKYFGPKFGDSFDF